MPSRFRLPITKPISPILLTDGRLPDSTKVKAVRAWKGSPRATKSRAFHSLVTLVASNGTGLVDVVLLVFGAGEFGRPPMSLSCLSPSYFSVVVLRPQSSYFEETLCCSFDIWKAAIAAGSDCFGVHVVNLSPALSLRVRNFARDEA
jgi:hypothetical protein